MRRCRLVPGLIVVFGGVLTVMGAQANRGSQGAIVEAKLIFELEDRPTPGCHASTIAQTHTGQIVAAWFAGADEGEDDVGIWVSRLIDGRWSRPTEVANGVMSVQRRYPCWNPVLFQPATGPLVLFFKVGPTPREWWGQWTFSEDDGRTWARSQLLPPQVMGPIKNKPIQLDDGGILCPSSSEHNGWQIHLEITNDLKDWHVVGPLNDGQALPVIQPTLLKYRDGRLQMLCRTRGKGFVAQTWSDDGGRSWSPLTSTDLPNPNSGIDAVTLRDGRQLLVYNHTTRGRSPLNAAVSSDGQNWDMALILEDQPGEYSYPAVIQTADGLVHATYTYLRKSIKHVVIDPSRL